MEKQGRVQKLKVQRYFQSIILPSGSGLTMTVQQMDQRIIRESDDLYSLFNLIVQIKNQQKVADNSISIFRRLATLIYCVNCDYTLYHSKIKTLVTFWWDSCIKHRKVIKQLTQQKNNSNQFQNQFIMRWMRNQFLFHCLRCSNLFIENYAPNLTSYNIIDHTHQKQLMDYIKFVLDCLKNELLRHQQQSQFKFLLSNQFSKFLLVVFYIRKKQIAIQSLFNEFLDSLKLSIRLLKKFFIGSHTIYRNLLILTIQKGYQIFKQYLPTHKRRSFILLLAFLNAKNQYQTQFKKSLINNNILNQGYKKGLIVTSRIINSWKQIYNKRIKYYKDIKPCQTINNSNQKNNRIEIISNSNEHYQSGKLNQQKINKKITSSRKVFQLKKRRCASFKRQMQKQNYLDCINIKSQIQQKINLQFQKINYLRNKSLSTFSSNKSKNQYQIRIKNNQNKQIEVKLDDCKFAIKSRNYGQPFPCRLILKRKTNDC